ncbi:probable purine permease 10 [Euphorbia lathyris]|uniref:probable purine permease 10 n=1 Tax=Euphorbia lathyris TaxID=212925 RepID=UPI003313E44E
MGDAPQPVQLLIMDEEYKEPKPREVSSTIPQRRNYNWWLKISLYIISLLCGQSIALILGRLYFVKGGNSKWLATLVQIIGFPVLIPYYFIIKVKKPDPNTKSPSLLTLSAIYLTFGMLIAADCYLYTIGLQYLPVSTYTLICASQLSFNSFFSYFLNSQKFTPFIINSLVLLTISSVLLVFNNESSDPNGVSRVKYIIGFVCTVAASAGYGLVMSLTQLCFTKVLKSRTFNIVMGLIIYQQVVASGAVMVGLFASGEWRGLGKEMEGYQLGKVSYVMNLVWTAITWQVFTIGCVGLIFEVTSLFSNAISVLGLPIVPVMAVFVFHDKMDGVKVISMVLAVWGFVSYVYQHYLDDYKSKEEENAIQISVSRREMNERL